MPTKRKAKKRRATVGGLYEFHGSFTSKAKAEERARARGGFFKACKNKGAGLRYVVMTESKVPF
jgi:hypothetical protein